MVNHSLVSLLLVLFVTSSACYNENEDWWIGLWQGVDPLDGGLITLSITKDRTTDGILNLRFSDTFIRACTNLPDLLPIGWIGSGAPWSRRGIYLLDAQAAPGVLVEIGSNNTNIPVEIYCYADQTDIDEGRADSSGRTLVTASLVWNFTQVEEDDVFIMSGSLFAGQSGLIPNDPLEETLGGDQSMRFHRVASVDPPAGAVSWWNGVWTGVDPLDGGIIVMSISPDNDNPDTVLNLRFSDTFIRACTLVPTLLPIGWVGDGASWSKRGIYLANSRQSNGDVLYTPDPDLLVENPLLPIQIYCFAGTGDAELTPGNSPGVEVSTDVIWSFAREGGYVVMSGTLFTSEDNPESAGGDLSMRFHRSGNGYSSSSSSFSSSLTLLPFLLTVLALLFLF